MPCGWQRHTLRRSGKGVEESAGIFASETCLEKYLRATVTFGTDSDDVRVGTLANLLLVSRFNL